jgi:hypothetical protein
MGQTIIAKKRRLKNEIYGQINMQLSIPLQGLK